MATKQKRTVAKKDGKTKKAAAKSKGTRRGLAKVSYEPYNEKRPLAGMTVGEVRATFAEAWSIDPKVNAYLNGEKVRNPQKQVVESGDRLEFARQAGEKGLH